MTDRFAVRPADLIGHGGHVDAVAERVEEATAAGRSVQAGTDAYGKLCAMVPVMLGALQGVLVEGLADSADALRGTGEKLRATARHYDGADRAGADAIARSGSGR